VDEFLASALIRHCFYTLIESVRPLGSISGFAYQYAQKSENLLSYEVIGLGARAVTFRFHGWQIQKPFGEK
jgi:hypothetical protein